MPRNRLPALVNRSRFTTRNDAKKTTNRIFANSPGWMLAGPRRIQMRAPLTSEREAGSTAGRASSTRPTNPAV
jgi:hypothetical protein